MKTGSRAVQGGLLRALKRKGCALLILSALLLLGRAIPLWSWESTFFDWFESSTSARAAAMGGFHTALADDSSVLFSNPAGLQSVERRITVAEGTLSFYESALEIAGEALAGDSGSSGNAIYSLWGPLAFSYVNKGRGFGIYGSSNVYLRATGPIPAAEATLEQNLVIIGARAFRIQLTRWRSTLDLGFSFVGFATLQGETTADFREVLQSNATIFDLLASGGTASSAMGVGVEFGLLYSFSNWLAVGIAGRNFAFEQIREFASILDFPMGASTSNYIFIPLYLSAGILFRPPLSRLSRVVSDLAIAIDYHDIFDFLIYPPAATNPLLHIGAGLELKLLEILSLRAGYYQCLPSFGVGLDLSLFTLNLAYFGRERSREPGGYPIDCYTIGVEFTY
jgi:hypothetical protein